MLPLRPESDCPLPFPIAARTAIWAHAARGLMHHLARALALPDGAELLVPDLHHAGDLAALRAAGARLRFYRVTPRLEVDVDDLARRATGPVRAVVLMHHLGWPDPGVTKVAELCRERGLVLVEHCAEALFAEHEGRPLGSFGDHALFSLPEWLPVPNGGLLVQNGAPLAALSELELRPCHPAIVAGRATELMLDSVRTDAPRLGALLRRTAGRARGLLDRFGVELATKTEDHRFDVEDAWRDLSPVSRHILERVDFTGIAERRRTSFAMLSRRLADHVLMPARVEAPGSAPLAFPIFVSDPRDVALRLAARGIEARPGFGPADRALDAKRQTAARWVREHLLVLPVHQSMDPEQVEHVARAVLDLGRLTAPIAPVWRVRPRRRLVLQVVVRPEAQVAPAPRLVDATLPVEGPEQAAI